MKTRRVTERALGPVTKLIMNVLLVLATSLLFVGSSLAFHADDTASWFFLTGSATFCFKAIALFYLNHIYGCCSQHKE